MTYVTAANVVPKVKCRFVCCAARGYVLSVAATSYLTREISGRAAAPLEELLFVRRTKTSLLYFVRECYDITSGDNTRYVSVAIGYLEFRELRVANRNCPLGSLLRGGWRARESSTRGRANERAAVWRARESLTRGRAASAVSYNGRNASQLRCALGGENCYAFMGADAVINNAILYLDNFL